MAKTICLNMIVKDESHIIEETLNNITSQIDLDYGYGKKYVHSACCHPPRCP